MGSFYFYHPLAIYLNVFLLIFIYIIYRYFSFRKKAFSNIEKSCALNHLIVPFSEKKFLLKASFVIFSLFLLTIALARPVVFSLHEPVAKKDKLKKEGKQNLSFYVKFPKVVFLIDTSKSMSAKDAPLGQSRFEFSKEIVDFMLEKLTGSSASLYALTSQVIEIVPQTKDYIYLRLKLRDLKINEGGVGSDIFKGIKAFDGRKNTTVIFLTDGENTVGKKGFIKKQRKPWVNWIIVGVGTKEGKQLEGVTHLGNPVYSHLDEVYLKKTVSALKGKYYQANDYSALELAKKLLKEVENSSSLVENRSFDQLQDELNSLKIYAKRLFEQEYHLYSYPLLLAIFLLMASELVSERRKR